MLRKTIIEIIISIGGIPKAIVPIAFLVALFITPSLICSLLFTADGFTGELIECNEGDLQWMDKKEVLALPTWEGDAIFLKLLIEEDEHRFFTLRLVYEGSKLVEKQLYRYS